MSFLRGDLARGIQVSEDQGRGRIFKRIHRPVCSLEDRKPQVDPKGESPADPQGCPGPKKLQEQTQGVQ